MRSFERFSRFVLAILVVVFLITSLLTLSGCSEDENVRIRSTKTEVEVYPGFTHESSLIHHWDSTRRVSVKDDMDARLQIWRTEDGEKAAKLFDNVANPTFKAASGLRYEEFNITEDQLNPKVIATWLARSSKDNLELDTLYIDFSDGQRDSIPVDISSFDTEISGNKYYYGTLTVIDANFISVTNLPLDTRSTRAGARRAPYIANTVNSEYKAMLTLQEKNLQGDNVTPQTFNVPVYAYAIRHIMKDDAIKSIVAENKNRVVLTDSTERCSFEKVITYESGDIIREPIQIILKREFKGIDTYEKTVSNFDFSFNKSNGVSKGTDAAVREDGKWLVSGRTDRYAATITNGVAADIITTDYSLYHERAVYTDDNFVVEFGYENVRCNELETTVTKQESKESGKSKALEHNKIQTVYIDYTQDLSEDVILVMTAKLVSSYEIANPNLKVYNDSVVATLDFITKYSDGSKETEHEHFKALRSLVCTTDWSSTQVTATQTTDETIAITTTSSNERKQGYWKFTEQTRRLDNYAHLSDASKQNNSWTSVVPNSIVYTREGKTHDFGVLAFAATHTKASLVSTGKTSGGESYKYTEEIKVRYQDNNQSITAPGKLLVNGSEVRSLEIRDKKLVVNNDKVTASLTFVTIYMNGTEDKDPVSKTFPRSLKVNTNWNANESSADQTTGQPNVVKTGSQSKTDGEWKWNEETRSITSVATLASSKQNNNWTSVDPNNIVFTRNGQSIDFGSLSFSAAYVNAASTLKNKSGVVETYDYTNTISVTFSDNTQTTTAPGQITVKKEIVPIGYEIINQKLDVQQNGVTASLDFVTKLSDGTSTSEKMQKFFARRFNVMTDWSSVETSNSQSTSATTVTLDNSENKVDGDWSYVNETRSISTTATLAGSTQTNGWKAVDPNNITFTKNGKTYSFSTLSFNASETGANVSKTSDNDDATVYSYKDNISVTFGSNNFASSAPGKITVNKPWNPDFPDEWGKFVDCKFTVAPDESRKTWVYTWSIHFEKGTLPVVVRKNASEAEINQSYFTSETNSRFNGGYYNKSAQAWVNTIASDEKAWMEWLNNSGKNEGNMAYSTATAWGWDNGAQNNGHPSVFTDRFTAKITNNKSVLTIYKDGKEFASYKAAK